MSLEEIEPVHRGARLALAQTLGVFFALFIQNRKKTGSDRLVLWFLVWTAMSAGAFLFPPESPPWYGANFLRECATAIVLSALFSLAPTWTQLDVGRANQLTQVIYATCGTLAFSLSPLLVSHVPLRWIYLLDAVLAPCLLAVYLGNRPRELASGAAHEGNRSPRPLGKPAWVAIAASGLVWASMGGLSLVEVPVLRERFGLGPSSMGILFLCTASIDLVAMRLVPEAILKQFDSLLTAAGTLLAVSCTLLYLFSVELWLSCCLLVVLGAASGLISISASYIVQRLEEHGDRVRGYLGLRLGERTGILAITLFTMAANVDVGRLQPLADAHWVMLAGCLGVLTYALTQAWRQGSSPT